MLTLWQRKKNTSGLLSITLTACDILFLWLSDGHEFKRLRVGDGQEAGVFDHGIALWKVGFADNWAELNWTEGALALNCLANEKCRKGLNEEETDECSL